MSCDKCGTKLMLELYGSKPVAIYRVMAMSKQRRPAGKGRLAVQRKLRHIRADEIADWILPHLNHDRIEATGHIFPNGSWRKSRVKAVFKPWLHRCTGSRMFTTRLCQAVVRRICSLLETMPPRHPRQPFSEWVGEQACRLKILVRAAKKRGFGGKKMDEFDTQLQDWSSRVIFSISLHRYLYTCHCRCRTFQSYHRGRWLNSRRQVAVRDWLHCKSLEAHAPVPSEESAEVFCHARLAARAG